MNTGHCGESQAFPNNKMIPLEIKEWGMGQEGRKVYKKRHNKRARRYVKEAIDKEDWEKL